MAEPVAPEEPAMADPVLSITDTALARILDLISDAPDGDEPHALTPVSKSTSTSIVGTPRLSKISRPCKSVIAVKS